MEDSSIKPVITVPKGLPPTDLVVEDLIVGDGPEATSGMQVTVDYAGISWSNGREFDASWNRNDTFSFGLGGGMVIQGWDQGVQGMNVGGRRRLTIPPQMGYGSQGAGGVIAPNETLIFVVDLRSVG
jgi:peptidylprolyl isomerase